MNNRRTILIALTFLGAITACVVPGLPTSSTSLPTPTVDTGRIETMVAGTVSAAIVQTEQFAPVPASTTVFTAAPIAAITSTPAPTETPTAEPDPTLSQLIEQEDGSLLFVDERAGYQIELPAGWLVMRINEKEYLDAFSLEEAANPHVQQSLLSVQNENPDVLRLFAVDANPDHIKNEFVTEMRLGLNEELDMSLNSDEELQAIASEIPATADIFRFEVTSINIVTSASGMDIGVIEARSSFMSPTGSDVTIYQKQVFFNVPAGTQSITLTMVAELKDTFLPVLDEMLETVNIVVVDE